MVAIYFKVCSIDFPSIYINNVSRHYTRRVPYAEQEMLTISKYGFMVSTLLLIRSFLHFYVSLVLFYLSRLSFYLSIYLFMSYFPSNLLYVELGCNKNNNELFPFTNFTMKNINKITVHTLIWLNFKLISLSHYLSLLRGIAYLRFLLNFKTLNFWVIYFHLTSTLILHIFMPKIIDRFEAREEWYLNTHRINQRYFISYSINAFVVNWTWPLITYNYPSKITKLKFWFL